jgi:hypothetical protein
MRIVAVPDMSGISLHSKLKLTAAFFFALTAGIVNSRLYVAFGGTSLKCIRIYIIDTAFLQKSINSLGENQINFSFTIFVLMIVKFNTYADSCTNVQLA